MLARSGNCKVGEVGVVGKVNQVFNEVNESDDVYPPTRSVKNWL